MDAKTAYDLIRKLRPKQRDVLGNIAMNQDEGHHPETLKALESRGLIVSRIETLGGRFPVRVKRYYCPITVHFAYCEWASEQPEVGASDAE